ncbi:cupin domain-containing protein [Phytoactinopolyspora limicola]|uniref:cupin domain-containing protein n=1 Tax=Phytoactinopolyspora limicola TaxID=2715536 RepID=UPI00140B10D3|nr:cupin domain-containing protein [Phytoactinopolyspora limicola]
MTTNLRPAEFDLTQRKQRPLVPPSATPIKPEEILTRNHIIHISDDKKVVYGLWECEPGTSRWEYEDRQEMIYVLAGKMTVQEDGGDPVELTPGMSAAFPVGWRGTWDVHETFKKIYVVVRP